MPNMDRRTAESLDHWLTTPPEDSEPDDEQFGEDGEGDYDYDPYENLPEPNSYAEDYRRMETVELPNENEDS